MAHPSIGVVLDIARGIRDPVAPPDRGHVDTCATCRRTAETMHRLADFTAREADYEVPPAAAALADAILPERAPAGSWLKALAAQLVYDSARDPLPAGARSQNAARQFLYEAGSYSLDLHVSDEWGRREREAMRVIVVGQISDRRNPAKAVRNRRVELRAGEELVAQTVSNPQGEFHLESGRRDALRLRWAWARSGSKCRCESWSPRRCGALLLRGKGPMKTNTIACVVLLGVGLASWTRAEEPQEYLLRLEREDRLARVLKDKSLTLVRTIGWLHLHVVTGPAGVPPETLEASVRAHRDVWSFEREQRAVMGEVDAHPDLKETTATLHDALAIDRTPVAFFGGLAWKSFASQPALDTIDVPASRATGNIGSGVIVAVIDAGVDLNHELLENVLVDQGYDFTRDVPLGSDWADLEQSTAAILDGDSIQALEGRTVPAAFGHGTMVAGLVRAVAPGARILPVKAFRADGTGRAADIAQAIYYSVMRGAKVINMSFSFTAPSTEVMWATAWAAQSGAVLVSSAGNRGQVMRVWPAEHKWVISVGSTSLGDVRSAFSNHGYDVFKVGAPGERLLTLYPGGRYASVSGTSFSTALVTGTIALMSRTVPFLEWGATDDVMRVSPFADIANVERDTSNRYPKRLVAPTAVEMTPAFDRTRVKQLNNVY